MQVKGTAVQTIPIFIKAKFGEQSFQKWLSSLSPDAQQVYSKDVLTASWYPVEEILIEPTKKLCDMFYFGKLDGAVDQGRYSAEHALKGIYKLFVKLGSPDFIAGKASTIFPTYYQPSAMETVEKGTKTITIRITKFEHPHTIIEHRIKGWIERALEISGAKIPKVQIKNSMSTGAQFTDFVVTWN